MWNRLFSKIIGFFTHIGMSAEDNDEIRLQKALLVFSALMMSTAGWGWGLSYFLLGNPVAGAIPTAYAVLSYSSVALFAWSRRYQLFRTSQLLLSLALPFFLMLSLGGYVNSSAVVLWSLTCPLGALVFAGRRQAAFWFLAYIGLVFASVLIDPWVSPRTPLPAWVVTIFFALNLTGVSVVAFVMLQYFVGQRDLSFRLLHAEQEKTENLLLNILPKEIAVQLKDNPGTVASHYDDVTILFADLVGFTPLAASLPAKEMVEWLNEIFTHFDDLMDRYVPARSMRTCSLRSHSKCVRTSKRSRRDTESASKCALACTRVRLWRELSGAKSLRLNALETRSTRRIECSRMGCRARSKSRARRMNA
jgi:guanylate cyclase